MDSENSRKIAGLALVIGAPTYTIAELIKRRGDIGSSSISSMLETPGLTHAMAQLSILGLLLTLAGLYTFWRSPGHGGAPGFISRISLLSLTIGFAGFVISNGLDHVSLHILTHDQSGTEATREQMADAIIATRAGVVVVAGTVTLFGTMLLATSLRMTLSGFQRAAAHVLEVVAFVGLASHIMAEHFHTGILYTITGAMTLILTIWYVILGVGIIRSGSEPTDPSDS